ncbi:Stk1 family PASTA domain-containing Ser/Thr kinase [Aquibacillus koreensis]|uniref:Serine/threonine-protein kinase PrkC n=1 Tax=Aquibacillus koreensis TaxID=279446 RepID=A0A9X3WKI7_9BACI|nr:Stk1 family PASTA domain-containing Ser/Thr kinase [Aquibacillus koreensis]MCT2538015.1 Stk1 family PASTA domain-containing Ser/Thr kinase [Aquibacillus koreensis]MDC3420538.1 Stk1 family PASTA domain-containing Ser/Thr kinase [Aquibacillus koreensis]
MLEGRMLNERYKIKKMIGGGGMANVYLAQDSILDREVAIKVLRLEHANDDEFIARFHREAQSAISLSHPNIVNIYDVGEEDNIYYMVMEYVEGMTLKKYIQTYGPAEVQEAIDIMKQITSAISHAHANDIVHRDIKPQNILIDPYGVVKVTDFGIAIALSATALTQTNSVLGSVHYLSPEQARGGMANKKSDIYSLGIVLFELLTGRLPFSGQSAVSIALKHLQINTPSIRRWKPEIPQSVENIVLKSTTKDPFHRYDTVYELEEALSTAMLPERINEEVFVTPEDSGEATKAIPIITEERFKQHKSTQDTLIHHTEAGNTKHSTDENNKEQEPNLKKKKRAKAWVWISVILVVLFGAFLAALFIIPSMLQPADVDIPDVVGEDYEDALSELTTLNLKVDSEEVFSDEFEEGVVVSTTPESGMTVKEGDAVTLFTSKGKEKVAFEDYVGEDYSQVRSLLIQKGYTDITYNEENSDEPEGQIIAQEQPEPGEQIIPEETSVIFTISKGPKMVELINFFEWRESAVTSYLKDKKLGAKIDEEHHDEVREGFVIRQSPEAGTEVEENAVVEIVLSLGPEEKPPVTHELPVTVPYTGRTVEDDTNNDTVDNPDENNNEPTGPEPQEITIYVEDANEDGLEPYIQREITEDTVFNLVLYINPNDVAQYRILRDGELLYEKIVKFEDVEDE